MIATEADLPRILEFAKAFHAYSPWSVYPMDPEATETYARNVMTSGVILISDKGMLGGLVHQVPFAPSVKAGVELFWWGDGHLKKEFEAWCREQGCNAVQFSALADDRSGVMERLFRRDGYRPVETGYLKDL